MDEACAEGIREEHYRLEGGTPIPSSSFTYMTDFAHFYLDLDETMHSSFSDITPPSPSTPHLFIKRHKFAAEVPFTSLHTSPLPLYLTSPSPQGVLLPAFIPPCFFFPQCDVILDLELWVERKVSSSLTFKDRIECENEEQHAMDMEENIHFFWSLDTVCGEASLNTAD